MNKFIIKWFSRIVFNLQNEENKKIFRNIEKTTKKYITNKLHLLFNKTCINENLLPNYTNFKVHDAAARNEDFITTCRKELILRQIKEQEESLPTIKDEISHLQSILRKKVPTPLQHEALQLFLQRIAYNFEIDTTKQHERKLINLYGGNLLTKQEKESCINLSNEIIDREILEIFSLGMNCHLKSKYDQTKTKIEIEKLFNNIKKLEYEKNVTITDVDRLTCELKRFGLKNRNDFSKNILTKEQFRQIREFNKKENIIVRKADKNNNFVIMKKEDYCRKLSELISDPNKFKQSEIDPTEQIKKDLNKLISASNNVLPKIKGHFEPGYIYGNPKTHKNKNDPPLRPIISQIGTVTYETSKKINDIISPFMPR